MSKITTEVELIDSENECLARGLGARAFVFDNHKEHIRAHMHCLSTTIMEGIPVTPQPVLDHVQEHINMLRHPDSNRIHELAKQLIEGVVRPQ